MKFKDYPINYIVEGLIDGYNLYEIINRSGADVVATTMSTYLTHGSLLFPYENLELIDIEIDLSLENDVWYLLKNNIPVGKVTFYR